MQQDDTRVTSGGFELKATSLASLSSRAEDTIRRHYSLSTEVDQTHSETVTLNVPARRAVRLVLDWKMTHQVGLVRVTDADGTVEIPFEVELGLTFDQRLDDMR